MQHTNKYKLNIIEMSDTFKGTGKDMTCWANHNFRNIGMMSHPMSPGIPQRRAFPVFFMSPLMSDSEI